ncbi:DUF4139 domain-containing protein [bacterium]|nr:DUF4139 domain-containing protein [bacterium]
MKKIIFFMIALSQFVIAQSDLKIKTVDVFKNGSAFYVAEGSVKLSQGSGTIGLFPQAMFGTIWLASTEKNITVDEIKAVKEKTADKREAANFFELLKANVGKKVVWHTGNDKDAPINAILLAVNGSDDKTMITLKIGNQIQVLHASWYTHRVEFPENFATTFDDSTYKTVLKIKTNTVKTEAPFQMIYFQKGLGWVPSYRVDLLDDKNAQLVLSASLINDTEDLDKVNLNFVVGYPHFLFSNVEAPLTANQFISNFLQTLSRNENAPAPYGGAFANIAAQEISYGSGDSRVDFGDFEALKGEAEGDLFFYNLKNVSLKKGERAQYNIFSATVPYRHIYEVSVPNGLNQNQQYDNASKGPHEVWHSIKLENKSNFPWTTGSAMTMQNGRALGQDILKYTAMKSSNNLKITVAPDILVEDDEKELSRKEDIKRKDGYVYDLVSVNGEITINNSKNEDVTVTVYRPITGKILTASDQPKIKQIVKIGSALNQENSVTWEIPVKAGETKQLKYQYEVFLRNY